MTVDRLSVLDECFLRLETSAAHMHIGWTLLVDGEPPELDDLRAHISSRLVLLPRFRRRVLTSPLHVHDPVWVDDPAFDIREHVQRAELPSPGGRVELREVAGELLSIPLDRRRPLWRVYLIDGLRDDRFAVVGQAHHALVDGIAAVEMAQLLLDGDPSVPAFLPRPLSPAPGFSPQPEPGLVERTLASASDRLTLARSAVSLGFRALGDREAVGEAAAQVRRLGQALSGIGTSAPPTSLNQTIGPNRSVAFVDLSLAAASDVGRRGGATVNDVVLATAALALGRYLRRAGECHPWLRVLVPVNRRGSDPQEEIGGGAGGPVEPSRGTEGGRALGNRISFVFVELPTGERDPRVVLQEIRRQTTEHKRADHAGAFDALVRAAGLIPVQVRDAVAWLASRPQTFNTVVSDIPGPPEPLFLLGRGVRAAYPAVPLANDHGLSIGALSYRGTLHVGLYADPGVVPDLVDITRDVSSSFDALRLTHRPRKAQARRRRAGARRQERVTPLPV